MSKDPYAKSGGLSGSPINKQCTCMGIEYKRESELTDGEVSHYCIGVRFGCSYFEAEHYWDDIQKWYEANDGVGNPTEEPTKDEYYSDCP